MSSMDELLKLAGVIPTQMADGPFIVITCGVGFEPHGRASETWEVWWTLDLPRVPYYWQSTTGWRKGNEGITMQFHGRTELEVIDRACHFLQWYNSREG